MLALAPILVLVLALEGRGPGYVRSDKLYVLVLVLVRILALEGRSPGGERPKSAASSQESQEAGRR